MINHKENEHNNGKQIMQRGHINPGVDTDTTLLNQKVSR